MRSTAGRLARWIRRVFGEKTWKIVRSKHLTPMKGLRAERIFLSSWNFDTNRKQKGKKIRRVILPFSLQPIGNLKPSLQSIQILILHLRGSRGRGRGTPVVNNIFINGWKSPTALPSLNNRSMVVSCYARVVEIIPTIDSKICVHFQLWGIRFDSRIWANKFSTQTGEVGTESGERAAIHLATRMLEFSWKMS